ncbi:MAG: pilus assembly PilX family protein [Candidatus Saccharimonadales bacterium]
MIKIQIIKLPRLAAGLKQRQDGFAAFAVTLIMIIVLSLIVLGFASNARQEQRRAVDAQLSTTAYYAAESGVNDAYAVIKADIGNTPTIIPPNQTSCTGGSYGGSAASNLSSNVAYTCLLVNTAPLSLNYVPLATGHGQVVPIFGQNGAGGVGVATPVKSITISWQQDGASSYNFSSCPSNDSFPARDSWPASTCSAGMLQVDIAPASGWTNQSQLQKDTKTVFLQPGHSAGSASISNGEVVSASCGSAATGQYACTEDLSGGLPSAPNGTYYLHITPIYLSADLSITASSTSSDASGQLHLYNAQALIDSTGKASDELRRIQERVSINSVGNNDVPDNALQIKNGICKQFTVRPFVVGINTAC